jgi:glycine C-acetyltransferase
MSSKIGTSDDEFDQSPSSPIAGGYTTGRKEVVDTLRQKARPYLFSNSLAPAVVGASLAALDLLEASTELRDRLEENTLVFRKEMTGVGSPSLVP